MNAALQVLFRLKFFVEDMALYAQSDKCMDKIINNMNALCKPNSYQTRETLLHVSSLIKKEIYFVLFILIRFFSSQGIIAEMSTLFIEYGNLEIHHDCGEFLNRLLDHIKSQQFGQGWYNPVDMSFDQTVMKIHRCQR